MIYKELYDLGVSKLKGIIAEDKLDARYLLEEVCHTNRNTLLAHGDMEVSKDQEEQYLELISKRAKRIPLQHITGKQEFMGLEFSVNENVLIPRQDTEVLVEEVMRYLHDGMRILDMCTGSGCILLSLLNYSNDCSGVGVDLSEKALEVAKLNHERICRDKESASFLQSDLFDNVDEIFDIIVSNPPYIRTDVIGTLEPEVKEHEPMMALDGFEDGLYFYRKIIEESKTHLWAGGMLFFEIGYDQGESVSELMRQAGFIDVTVIKDFAGLNRVVLGTLIEGVRNV